MLGNLAYVCVDLCHFDTAWKYMRESVQKCLLIQDIPHQLSNLVRSGRLLVQEGEYERAAQILGLALHHPASYIEVEDDAQPVLEELRKALAAEELQAALERGRALDLDQVVDDILAYTERQL